MKNKNLLGIITGLLFSVLISGVANGASVFFPYQGGTGTSTVPTAGKVLSGNASGTYSPVYITAGTNITSVATTTNGGITINAATQGSTTTINSVSGPTFTFNASTTGTDFTISTSTANIYFNFPSASASNRGLLLSGDWTTFNNKISTSTGLVVANFASSAISQWTNNGLYLTTSTGLGILNFTTSSVGQWANNGLYLTTSTGLAVANFASPNLSLWTNNLGWITTSTGLTTSNFATTSISQWNNNSGYITTSTALTTANFATTSISQWNNNSGYITTDQYWTGTSTNLVAATGRTSLGLGSIATFGSGDYKTSSSIETIAGGGTATSTTPANDNILIGNGTNFTYSGLPSCASGQFTVYTSSTKTWTCSTPAGAGTLTGNSTNTYMAFYTGATTLSGDSNLTWTLNTKALNLGSGGLYQINGNNMIIGYGATSHYLGNAGNITATGVYNIGVGALALNGITTGGYNTAIGSTVLFNNTTGAQNTALGYRSLLQNATGSNNVALGYNAGQNEMGSNAFYLNNVDQATLANDKAYSLLYGNFAGAVATTTGQQLTVNGNLYSLLGFNASGTITQSGVSVLTTSTALTTANFATTSISQWTNNSGYVTSTGSGSVTTSSAITAFNFPYWANTTGGLMGTSTIFYASSTGNVGIGTTNPSSTLHIYQGGTLQVGNSAFYVSSSTNVGIGTMSPGTLLDVNGVTTITGNIHLKSGNSLILYDTINTATGTIKFSDGTLTFNKGITQSGGVNSIASTTIAGSLAATTITATTSVTVAGSAVSTSTGANPTATIGTSAVNGSANTFLRSDGSPALGSKFASSSISFNIFDATSTVPYRYAKWRANRAITLASVSCDEYAAATTTIELYRATALATTTVNADFVSSIQCGVSGTTTTTFTTSSVAVGDFIIANTSSTLGTPTLTTVNVYFSVN